MSHFKEYQTDSQSSDGRNLGDEWTDWNGKGDPFINEGKRLFLIISTAVILLISGCAVSFVYLITPRLALWHASLPILAWTCACIFVAVCVLWFLLLIFTIVSGKKVLASPAAIKPMFDLVLSGAFRLANVLHVSRDRIGHSFVRVSNAISRTIKKTNRQEKLLILLPRCLTKEQLKEINDLKNIYPISIHTVSGGELARKRVKELRPTAVIGVACERDLVSGIRDVGSRFSVIGIPNKRPQGPCKDTQIDMKELIEAIEFFVGPPSERIAS